MASRSSSRRAKRARGAAAVLAIAASCVCNAPGAALASNDTTLTAPRPFVEKGIYDRPFITRASGRTLFGGYAETAFRVAYADGAREETSFLLPRLNLFTFAPLSDRVRLAAEIEFEEGGEEVVVELAIIDVEIDEGLTFRGGVLLSPLGRFNVAHDSPANELIDRPLVSTEIIAATLSEPGMGFLGAFYPSTAARVTYEIYAVNGLNDGVLAGSADGTRIAGGKKNWEDNNARPSVVGRVAVSPAPRVEVGLSAHSGPYNTYTREGLAVDERRDVSIFAIDLESSWRRFEFLGEAARAAIDVPAPLAQIHASRQRGLYAQISARFLGGKIVALPESRFAAVVRYDAVDLDAGRAGDSTQRLTLGINMRPVSETVFKLDYQYDWQRDRFNVGAREAGVAFGVASYF
ncbi:MAG: hypothetical protein ACKVU1_02540 [bacterium]